MHLTRRYYPNFRTRKCLECPSDNESRVVFSMILAVYVGAGLLYLFHRLAPEHFEAQQDENKQSSDDALNSMGNARTIGSALVHNMQSIGICLPPMTWSVHLPQFIRDLVEFLGKLLMFSFVSILGIPECSVEASVWNVWYIQILSPVAVVCACVVWYIIATLWVWGAPTAIRLSVLCTLAHISVYVVVEGLYSSVISAAVESIACEKDGNAWVLSGMDRSSCTISAANWRPEGTLAILVIVFYNILPIICLLVWIAWLRRKQTFKKKLEAQPLFAATVGWIVEKYDSQNFAWEIVIITDKISNAAAAVPFGVANEAVVRFLCCAGFFILTAVRRPYAGTANRLKLNTANVISLSLTGSRLLFNLSDIFQSHVVKAVIQVSAVIVLILVFLGIGLGALVKMTAFSRTRIRKEKYHISMLKVGVKVSDEETNVRAKYPSRFKLERWLTLPIKVAIFHVLIAVMLTFGLFARLIDSIVDSFYNSMGGDANDANTRDESFSFLFFTSPMLLALRSDTVESILTAHQIENIYQKVMAVSGILTLQAYKRNMMDSENRSKKQQAEQTKPLNMKQPDVATTVVTDIKSWSVVPEDIKEGDDARNSKNSIVALPQAPTTDEPKHGLRSLRPAVMSWTTILVCASAIGLT
eukprot:g354.t1